MRCAHLRAGVAVAALAAALGGCALKAPPSTAELQKEAMPHTALPPAWTTGGASAQPVADRWLESFDDPALTALVGESLAYNADLQVAAARVEQAGGYLKVASGSLLPSDLPSVDHRGTRSWIAPMVSYVPWRSRTGPAPG